MSTHAYIGVEESDGYINYVYVHSDGYPSYTGHRLLQYYATYAEADALVSMGGLSVLGNDLDTCCFYHRDKEEALVCECDSDIDAFTYTLTAMGVSYGYVYNRNLGWLLLRPDGALSRLTPEECNE